MSCADIEAAIPVYLDGELDPAATLELERHLRGCERCSAVASRERELRLAYRDGSLRFEAPEELATRVRRALAARAGAERVRGFPPRRRLAIAASFVLAVAVTALVTRLAVAPSGEPALLGQVLSSHVRSLMTGQLTEVASSDQHTVKPWFAGKLDFSPPVTDLAAEGFPLAGGRVDVLDGRPVAALVYRRRQHVINLFAWPAARGPMPSPGRSDKNGYHMVAWSRSGMTFSAISDVEAGELDRFAALLGGPG